MKLVPYSLFINALTYLNLQKCKKAQVFGAVEIHLIGVNIHDKSVDVTRILHGINVHEIYISVMQLIKMKKKTKKTLKVTSAV